MAARCSKEAKKGSGTLDMSKKKNSSPSAKEPSTEIRIALLA